MDAEPEWQRQALGLLDRVWAQSFYRGLSGGLEGGYVAAIDAGEGGFVAEAFREKHGELERNKWSRRLILYVDRRGKAKQDGIQ